MGKKVILVTSLFRYILFKLCAFLYQDWSCVHILQSPGGTCVFENRNWCGSPDCQEKLEEWHAYPIVKIRVNNALIWTNFEAKKKKNLCVHSKLCVLYGVYLILLILTKFFLFFQRNLGVTNGIESNLVNCVPYQTTKLLYNSLLLHIKVKVAWSKTVKFGIHFDHQGKLITVKKNSFLKFSIRKLYLWYFFMSLKKREEGNHQQLILSIHL